MTELRRLHDRCDRCGAQAFVAALKASRSGDLTLLFCAHHFRRHEAALTLDGWHCHDERDKLEAEVQASRPMAFGGVADD